LLPAAARILDALDALDRNEEFWTALLVGERALQRLAWDDWLAIEEVFAQDLSALLTLMGSTPPPPADILERDLLLSLADAFDRQPPGPRVNRLRDDIIFFKYRLRRLMRKAEEDGIEELSEQAPDPDGLLRSRVRQGLEKAVIVIGPAALAAAAVALVFPPAAAAAVSALRPARQAKR
jgi:hypothetical protein